MMYIKDLDSGRVRKYGTDRHDSLHMSPNGKYLTYYNLQCGESSECGSYRFCDKDGLTPEEAAEKYNCIYNETDSYFNIGGFDETTIDSKYDLIEALEDLRNNLYKYPVDEDIYISKISEMIEFIEGINITL